MKRLQMAVIGVGSLGQHHARILSEHDLVDLVAVTDINAERAQEVAERCQTASMTDHHALVKGIDAVVIAVPTSSHLRVAADFLRQRVPVLVEKPIASNLHEAEQLVRLAETAQTPLQIGHVERFNPAAQALKTCCREPKYIRAERLSPFSFRSTDIGVVHDLMIHDIDLVLDLVRVSVVHVEALGISIMGDHEDTAQARIHFENGCIADLTASRVSAVSQRTMQAWSLSGCVAADFNNRKVVHYTPSQTLLYGVPPVERARQPNADILELKREVLETFIKVNQPQIPPTDALTAELNSFVDCVLAKNQTPAVSGAEALATMKLASTILTSLESHQWDGNAQGAIGPLVRHPQPTRMAG